MGSWKWFKLLKKIGCFFIWILIIVIIIRLCFFDIFNVPSSSMENSLMPSDLIVTNKILYSGPLSKLLLALKIKADPKTNDILVFKISSNDPVSYVKRCVGKPGETIKINNSIVLINEKPLSDFPTVCHLYKVWHNNYNSLKECLNYHKMDFRHVVQKYSNYVVINLDNYQKKNLSSCIGIDSIGIFIRNEQNKNSLSNFIAPGYGKNITQILIPFKGMKIKLDSVTVKTYNDILKKYENIKIEQIQGSFFINNQRREEYVFENDYYFMMGDNRDQSVDSRFFGIIPKGCITGKVIYKI